MLLYLQKVVTVIKEHNKISLCKQWADLTTARKQTFDFFNHFTTIPSCINKLRNYGDLRKLSICTLFCSTFKLYGYTYTHLQGKISVGATSSFKDGMLGILHNTDESSSD